MWQVKVKKSRKWDEEPPRCHLVVPELGLITDNRSTLLIILSTVIKIQNHQASLYLNRPGYGQIGSRSMLNPSWVQSNAPWTRWFNSTSKWLHQLCLPLTSAERGDLVLFSAITSQLTSSCYVTRHRDVIFLLGSIQMTRLKSSLIGKM